MPSRGSGLAVAVASTTLSWRRTTADPCACLANFPVSKVSCLPPARSTVMLVASGFMIQSFGRQLSAVSYQLSAHWLMGYGLCSWPRLVRDRDVIRETLALGDDVPNARRRERLDWKSCHSRSGPTREGWTRVALKDARMESSSMLDRLHTRRSSEISRRRG